MRTNTDPDTVSTAHRTVATRYIERRIRLRAMSMAIGAAILVPLMGVMTGNAFFMAQYLTPGVVLGALLAGGVLGVFDVRRVRKHAHAYADLESGGEDAYLRHSRLLLLDGLVLLAAVFPLLLLGFRGGLIAVIVCFLTEWLVWSWGSGSLLRRPDVP